MHNKLLIYTCLILLNFLLAFINSQGLDQIPFYGNRLNQKQKYMKGDQVTNLLDKQYSPADYASQSSYVFQRNDEHGLVDFESKESCRLNSKPCDNNSQCCSKYCRCTAWSTMGREACWRRCL